MRRYGDLDLKRNVKGTCSVPFLWFPSHCTRNRRIMIASTNHLSIS